MRVKRIKILRTLAIAAVLSLVGAVIVTAPVLAAPEIVLSPTSGALGTEVTVSGINYESYRGDNISIYFDGREMDTLVVPDSGDFTADFVVPDAAVPGRTYVSVRDELGNQLGTRRPFIIEEIGIEIYPQNGAVGTEVTITGKGSYAGEEVTVYYNGVRVDDGTEVASPVGEFSYSFVIPESVAGDHEVMVEDALGNSDEADFKVIPSIALGPSSGAVGDEVTVSGAGFGSRIGVTVYFDKAKVSTERTDRKGSFEASFNVPVMSPGNYEIKAEDDDDNRSKAQFTISAGIYLSQYEGNVGTMLTVSGIGFLVDRGVTVAYDDIQIATADTDGNGAFSVTFVIPASIGGNHTVTVGDGTSVVTRIFTMESEAPPVPAPLLPEEGGKSEAETYFDWEDVDDPSGVAYTLQIAIDEEFTSIVLEREGLTPSDYLLTVEEKLSPTKKDAPYYWRVKAVDGASNDSGWSTPGSFYVSSGFAITGTTKNVLIGLGVAGGVFLGFWLGRRTAYSKV